MRVCIVGQGAREHALALSCARSADVAVTPGGAGISGEVGGHRIVSVAAPPEELEADLFVIGPEAPLVAGLADRLRAQGKRVFGPGSEGASLEGSKRILKELVTEAGVATARWASFGPGQLEEAKAFLSRLEGGFVVKTDGLAAGKGVTVTGDADEAAADLEAKLSGAAFGDAGRRVVVEERLDGAEVSVFAVCDGRTAVALLPAQDYKRLGAGDVGPNTGGMGAYSPVPAVSHGAIGRVLEEIVHPTLRALSRRGVDYRGVLYAGIMWTGDGPRLLEFNVRFGDPETEVVLPLLEDDLVDLLGTAASGSLAARSPRFAPGAAVCVVAAAAGYPLEPRIGDPIYGLEEAATLPGVSVLHAATTRAGDGTWRTAGGRIVCLSATGADHATARGRAYEAVALVAFEGMQVRGDVAAAPLSWLPGARQ